LTNIFIHKNNCFLIPEGGTLLVAQLVEALSYKPEGRWFDSRWHHWNFVFT
jgi:predicted NACHT family NTPase